MRARSASVLARVILGVCGVLALALGASACSDAPSPPARGNGSTTTAAHEHAFTATSTSTSTSGAAGGVTSATATSSTGGPAGQSPTLGVAAPWGASAVGFGQVRPAEISLGGDPTGVVTGITWQSWGGSTALGTGTSTYVGPNQSTAQGTAESATVVASDLGTCSGRSAYQQVKWYFPEKGGTLGTGANSTISACTGP